MFDIPQGPEPFSDLLSKFVFKRTYARWDEDLGRREEWSETVLRAVVFLAGAVPNKLTVAEIQEIWDAIYRHDALPSMRLLWSAGTAAHLNNITCYNCAFLEINDLRAFSEVLYILMCGTGVGASVEEEAVSKLPRVKRQQGTAAAVHTVADSREGWADALLLGLTAWFGGADLGFDYSQLRPAGAKLKTMGGRSSGPEPLKRLLDFARARILSREGRRLRTIDAADIINMIGECVVAGGVRRSSEILLFSPDDMEMQRAKSGAYWNAHPYRRMANNSVAFNEKPSNEALMQLWTDLVAGKSGEPGLFNRQAIRSTSPRRKRWHSWGTNPCGEIFLRGDHALGGGQFCNLSEVVARPSDDLDALKAKVRVATIIGTIQATLTNFPYLREGWKANCEEERLLGVSITGQADCPLLQEPGVFEALKEVAIATNKDFAERFGINQAAAITCVKPSGTAAKMVGSSSGIHTRWSPYYIQRIRINTTDPLLTLAKQSGIPAVPEFGQDPQTATTWVLEFPMRSPEGAITRHDLTAMDQLERWLQVKQNFTEHNPSCTIYVKEHEWIQVLAWVEKHWDLIGGLSFFPSDDHVYPLAPYEEITGEKYLELMRDFPYEIDYSLLNEIEKEDNTTGARELACAGGQCEI